MISDHISAAPRCLALQEFCSCKSAGIKMLFPDVQSHAEKLLAKFSWGTAACIGKKQKTLVFSLKPFHEFLYSVEEFISMVDYTIHITDEAFF